MRNLSRDVARRVSGHRFHRIYLINNIIEHVKLQGERGDAASHVSTKALHQAYDANLKNADTATARRVIPHPMRELSRDVACRVSGHRFHCIYLINRAIEDIRLQGERGDAARHVFTKPEGGFHHTPLIPSTLW